MARGLGRFAVLAVILVFGAFDPPGLIGQQRGHEPGVAANFAADGAFTGSSLTGWRPVGGATGAPRTARSSARPGPRAAGCSRTRPTKTSPWWPRSAAPAAAPPACWCAPSRPPGGGTKGILVSLTAEERASYHVTLDAQGRETSRDRLRAPAPGQLRVAPPAPATPPAPPARRRPWAQWSAADARRHCRHRLRGPRTTVQGRRVEHHRSRARRQHPARLPERRRRHRRRRGRRRVRRVRADRALCRRRRRGAVPQGRPTRTCTRGWCPRNTCRASSGSRRLTDFYYSWGPAIADFNHDGRLTSSRVRSTISGPTTRRRARSTWRRRSTRGRVLQRAAVRRRLHRRRLAGRAASPRSRGRRSLRESARRAAALG